MTKNKGNTIKKHVVFAKYKIFMLNVMDWFINSTCTQFLHKILSYFYTTWMRVFKNIEMDRRCDDTNIDNYKTIQKYRKDRNAFDGLNVTFICDGNRRWAKKNKMDNLGNKQSKVEGGLNKINQVIAFLYANKCKSVSFYVFAIRNLQRAKEEIDAIKNEIKTQGIRKYALKVRIYGDITRFEDEEVEKNILKWESNSNCIKDDKFTINLFLLYNSKECDEDKHNERLFFDDDVDILIRTSGERRLSDFLARHVAKGTAVKFINPLWPYLTVSHIFCLLQQYKLERRWFG